MHRSTATHGDWRRHDDGTGIPGRTRFSAAPSHRLRNRIPRFPVAGARRVQLGARLLRSDGARQRSARAVDRRCGDRQRRSVFVRADVRALVADRELAACDRRRARRPDPADAAEPRRAVGRDAGRDEARRDRIARDHAAVGRRRARPRADRRREIRDRRRARDGEIRTGRPRPRAEDRRRRTARRLARDERRLRGERRVRTGRRHARERSDAAVFHVGHDVEAEARRAYAPHLSGRSPVDNVLDRPGSRATSIWKTSVRRAGRKNWGSGLVAAVDWAAVVFAFNYARFEPKLVLEALVRYQVTTLCAPPTVWRMLVQQPLASFDVKLREIVGAGEPLNPEIIERVKKAWGITIRDGYGQTETTCMIGNSPGQPVVAGSMGRPLPGYRVTLLDPDGAPVDEGEIALPIGAGAVRPVGLMNGYANNPDATAHAMRDGHYRTSDIAMRRDDGYYVYIGRADDVFKSSDYRLSPFELESVLIEHPAIAEAAVVPSPDPVRLAVPKTFVTLRQGYEESPALALEIFRFSREKLAPYKRIRRLQFAELPKTISGKIRRVELRRREIERGDDPSARMPGEYWEEDFAAELK
ncbi:Non-ribosomal peptide synthetase [Burkholderia dolosa AU0158]|nr:Non-ribosomal peptide synthetase [Burkholderia dolosa AU0158]